MKIERFLKLFQEKILNYPDISFQTAKIFFDKFVSCLSDKEKERFIITISMISEFSLKQISIDSFIENAKILQLECELTELKKDDKPK